MNFIRLYKSRKYLLKLLLSITVLMVAFLSVSTTLLFYNSDKTMLQMQQQADLKVLSQIKYNIDYMHDTVKNIAVSTFFDPDVVYLSNINVMDMGELAQKLNRLEKTVSNSSFLQNITIYNAKTGCYYSTLSSLNCQDDGMNGVIDAYIHSQKNIPVLTFVPLYTDKMPFPSLAMFIYDNVSENKLVVTIKPSWLFDNLADMNKTSEGIRGSIFITDKSGIPLMAQQQSDVASMDSIESIIREKVSAGITQDYLVRGSGNAKSILSFTSSNKNDWVIVSDQPYKIVWGKLSKMRVISFAIIIVFLILSVAGSLLIAYRLYRPIENLLNQVTGIRSKETNDRSKLDELKVISTAYQDVMHQLVKHESEEHTNRDAQKTYALRRLISDASLPTQEEMEQVNWDMDFNQGLRVCVLLIDDFAEFESKTSDGEKRMYKFAVANITKELVSKSVNCEVVPMGNDHFVLLISDGNRSHSDDTTTLTHTLKELQQTILQYYSLSITVSIGEKVDRYQQISQQYGHVLDNSNYRMIFGKGSIITPDLVRHNNDNITFQFPIDAVKKITEALKSGQEKDFQEHLDQLFQHMKVMHYNNIMYAILHLLALVENIVREMNSRTVRQVSLDFKRYVQDTMKQETLEPIYHVFLDIFKAIQKQRTQDVKEQSNQILTDTIKEMIEEQYKDLNLSMQSIAAAMKLSSAHVSKQFRLHESVSISEYINDVRLGKALQLLETKDYSITRIMEMVGYNNESYFFKLFKKKFGITPKEYRFKTVVQE
ncbi:helix-turn-helix transcriptional regulator [Paenibacillus aceris]|uniref:AraC-like DNA-binding protein n=1 Tax=Paenibacillus aceris TaxID=869555 RepID=A0ABS4I250_9BACL|nr:helix-turn-helix domain-containing protein [Paenibacillus aceris]MBP1964890.1 AraC-like DNA-binding protein [Paenibacillus aceris]NHW38135.1 AraC family transcriptional regulator [Paenibacillus aceris]